MIPRAFICGLSGTELTDAERRFVDEAEPWGIILFARNIRDAAQVRALVDECRALLGRNDMPVLIDQEGGRVQRVRPPLAERHPPAGSYAALYEKDPVAGLNAVRLGARLIAHELVSLHVNVDCLPVLDLLIDGAHDIIGDRAYGGTPEQVAKLARAACEGLLAGGVLPVVKHVPGHGRAMADSHLELPKVHTGLPELQRSDFASFRWMNDMPLAMTAHVLYTAIDPDRPATLSRAVIQDVIRGFIGFDGAIMSDDLSMKALSGSFTERTDEAFHAGCDLALHCNGDLDEMRQVAAASPRLDGDAARRCMAALSRLGAPQAFDVESARAMVRSLLPANVA
ncbi:beta-N-acetylhexosaminidase [Flaviflagellibacter deserti]|jgi:beta-N-acetylhexosaminidase|uniref:beta-N-acetylhexosaminidase n=1 Tax=Flaviflagellibacter deserti TaxID=2267266 RepID=A0ABV9Z3J5_9HYPH